MKENGGQEEPYRNERKSQNQKTHQPLLTTAETIKEISLHLSIEEGIQN